MRAVVQFDNSPSYCTHQVKSGDPKVVLQRPDLGILSSASAVPAVYVKRFSSF